MALGSPHYRTNLAPRRARSLQQLGVGQKACGWRSARSISGRCKISRNLRKRLECGAAIGPPGRGLGRAGEGRSEEVDGKYEGVVWQRGVVIQFPSLPAQLFFFSPPLLLKKPTTNSSSPVARSPAHARPLAARDLPREFHIGDGQVRRNAGGDVPGRTPWTGLLWVQSHKQSSGIPLLVATPPLPQGPLCPAHPTYPLPQPPGQPHSEGCRVWLEPCS